MEKAQLALPGTSLNAAVGQALFPACPALGSLLVQALVAQLRVTLQAIADFDTAIAQYAQSHPDFPLFQALPGAGPVFAPRLLVACGEQRERSASAAELQKYAGIAPVTERSGKKSGVHWRLQCPKFLRQTFVEWATESIRHAFWAQLYYQQQRDKGTPIRPPCGPWHSNGSASCITVGRSARRPKSPSLSRHLNDGVHRCSNSWHRHPAQP